jgi:hypothetical protein
MIEQYLKEVAELSKVIWISSLLISADGVCGNTNKFLLSTVIKFIHEQNYNAELLYKYFQKVTRIGCTEISNHTCLYRTVPSK